MDFASNVASLATFQRTALIRRSSRLGALSRALPMKKRRNSEKSWKTPRRVFKRLNSECGVEKKRKGLIL